MLLLQFKMVLFEYFDFILKLFDFLDFFFVTEDKRFHLFIFLIQTLLIISSYPLYFGMSILKI